ncbi:MAG: hypothetical protein Q8P41_32060 [Pseudomonadota bacterium]|nr:hypothetical protein [Pseudomonadota bacterium]
MRVPALFTVLLAGCFSPQGEPLEFETLPFENAYTQFPDIVLRPFTFDDLLCPDGEPSVFYAVYREGLTEPAPIVLFFHAGAFDYVKTPEPTDPLAGQHYQEDSRFTAEWAGNKVFETFGLLPGEAIDESEINEGTLPAALADAGAFTLYPANCWGDLWHNEDYYSPNDWNADGAVHRQGRFLAWWMTRIASTDAAEATEWRARYGLDTLTVPLDASAVHIVGLGEGGRAAAELLRRVRDAGDTHMPPVNGVIMDSTMDKLFALTGNDPADLPYKTGLQRIFPEETDGLGTDDIGQYSLHRWISERGLTSTLQLTWSSADPQVPDDTITDLIGLQTVYPTLMTVTDVGTTAHVFLNNDLPAARRAVTRMLGEE